MEIFDKLSEFFEKIITTIMKIFALFQEEEEGTEEGTEETV